MHHIGVGVTAAPCMAQSCRGLTAHAQSRTVCGGKAGQGELATGGMQEEGAARQRQEQGAGAPTQRQHAFPLP